MKDNRKCIYTTNAPNPGGCYSQAIKHASFLFLSGQIPINPSSGQLIRTDIKDEIRQCFRNLEAVCCAAGATLNDIVKLNVYFTDINLFPMLDEVFPEFFTLPFPARIRMVVQNLSMGARVEIDGILGLDE